IKVVRLISVISLLLFAMLHGSVLHGQTITSPQSITLPTPPATSYVVNSGQQLNVTSGVSITLKPGTLFRAGSTVLLKIEQDFPQTFAPLDPWGNWTSSRSFSASGAMVAEIKSFYDLGGRLVQSQYKNFSRNQVLASQVLYDGRQKAVGQTLPAPINSSQIGYKENFFLSPAGHPYNFTNFAQ